MIAFVSILIGLVILLGFACWSYRHALIWMKQACDAREQDCRWHYRRVESMQAQLDRANCVIRQLQSKKPKLPL